MQIPAFLVALRQSSYPCSFIRHRVKSRQTSIHPSVHELFHHSKVLPNEFSLRLLATEASVPTFGWWKYFIFVDFGLLTDLLRRRAVTKRKTTTNSVKTFTCSAYASSACRTCSSRTFPWKRCGSSKAGNCCSSLDVFCRWIDSRS